MSIDARGRFTRLFKQVKQLWEILLEHRFPPLLNNLSEVAGDGMNRHLSLAGKKGFSRLHVMSLLFCNEDVQVSLRTPEEFSVLVLFLRIVVTDAGPSGCGLIRCQVSPIRAINHSLS